MVANRKTGRCPRVTRVLSRHLSGRTRGSHRANRTYYMVAVALLKYAHRTLQEPRLFYAAHIERFFMRGMVLPLPEQRDRYVVRDKV